MNKKALLISALTLLFACYAGKAQTQTNASHSGDNPCSPPNTLTASNITDSSATLSWQHDCVDAPMGYIVKYKAAGDYNYTEFTVYDTNSVTLTGLSVYTDYYWRVKTLYNDSISTDWSSEATFKTDLLWVHPLPYYCDFEDAVENLAWNVPVISGNNVNRWYIGHNTYSSANTSLYVTKNANGSNNSYNCHQEGQIWTYRDFYFDPQYPGYEVSFDAKVYGRPNYAFAQLFVGAPVEPTDSLAAESMVLIDSMIGPTGGYNSAVWDHFDYTLDSTFAGHRRIFFMWETHNVNALYDPAIAVDNIAVSGIECSRPLLLTNVVADTCVQLSWRRAAIGTPASYTVVYKAVTDSVYTELETSDTLITLVGLQPLTDYTWKVRSNCSNEEYSEWSVERSFKTFQKLAVLPYVCGFEDSLENAMWTTCDAASSHRWCVGSAVQFNGQNTIYISKDNGITNQTNNPNYANTYLYRDFFFDPSYEEYLLEFDFRTFDYTSQTDISVYAVSPASPDFSAPSGGSRVESILFTDTLWHHVSIAINRTHDGVQRLVFEWEKDNFNLAKGSCAIDDITFTAVAFGRPYGLTSSNIVHNAALLSWTSGNRQAPASYQLAYRQTDDTAYNIVPVTGTVWQAESLMPATRYHWKVRAVAADGTLSAWSKEAVFYTSASTPYYTDFENDADWGGWHRASVSMNNDGWIIGNAVAFGGSYSLYVSHDGGATNTCNTMYANENPVSIYRDVYFVPGADEYHISFDYLGIEAEIRLQSLEDSLSNAVLVGSIPVSNQWQHYDVVIDSSFSGLQRLFFNRIPAGVSDKAGAVDNIVIEASTCPPPTSLAVTLTAHDAARLTWSPVGSQIYTVAYKPQSDTVYTMVTVQDTSILITNLIPDIPYFWKVCAQCDGFAGVWSSECPFNTLPLLPYFCDFEDGDGNAPWKFGPSAVSSVSGSNYWEISPLSNDNNNSSLHVSSDYGTGNYNIYITSRLWAYRDFYLAGGVSKYQISFDFKGMGQTNQDFARVYLGPPTTPSGLDAPEGAEQLGGDYVMIPTWMPFSFEVDSTHSGLQRLYIQWRCNNMSGANPGVAFDNFTVQASDCSIPVNLTTVSVSATTATLSWNLENANISPVNYTVAYKPLNDSVYTEMTTTDTVVQLTGLQPDTYYYWRVRSNCSGTDQSLWSNRGYFVTTQPTYATLPYECGFENATENASWSFAHYGGPNDWMIGAGAAFSGDSALYVSNDHATNHYSNSSASQIWAYRDFYFTPGNDEYELSFDFKGKGKAEHYARVFLGFPAMTSKTATPEGAELIGGKMYNQESWTHYHFYIDSAHSGLQRLYVQWINDTYAAMQPPAALDNIEIVAVPCRVPIELYSFATANSAALSWTMRRGGGNAGYTVAYRPQNDTAYTYVNVSDTNLLLQNLNSDVFYFWKVRHNCDESCSVWSEERMFYTANQVLYVCDFDTPESVAMWGRQGGDTAFSWFAGRHDESKPNGTLYVSSDSGQTNSYNTGVAADLWAFTDVYITPGYSASQLNFDFKGMGENDNDYLNVYVGAPVLPSGTATPPGAVVLAQKIGLKAEWTHYTFTIDSTHSGDQRIYFLWHNDNSDGSNPPAAIDNVCLSRETLPLPGEIHVSPYDTVAHLHWNVGDTLQPVSYTLAYAALASDSLMTEITLQDTVFDLTDLEPNIEYLCKVRANYADGGHSLWLMSQFRTLEYYARVPYYCDFENDTENEKWQLMRYGNVNQWVIDTAAANGGERSLYISDDGGATNEYAINSNTKAWAFRDIYLDPAQSPYLLYFDFRGVGELWYTQPYDYAKVFIGPAVTPDVSSYSAALPAGLTQLDTTLLLQTTWGTHTIILDSILTGYKRLYFLWSSDNMYGDNPAAAFDNVFIVPLGCNPPATIVVDSVSRTEVSFHITDYLPEHHDWDVTVVADGNTPDESFVFTIHDTMAHTFTDLDSGTVYRLYVRTRCSDNDFSDWISTLFVTPADTTQPVNPDDTVGVVHYLSERMIVLYPNPADQYVEVRADDDVTILYVEVYDLLGNRILQTAPQENPVRVRVSELASGLYLLRVTTEQGVITKRFVRR